jgi:ferredoxin
MLMIYFSGTGNSRFIAKMFCKRMKASCYSIEDKVDFKELLANSERIAFCYPIYASRPPKNMRSFVEKYKGFLNGKKLVILCTQALWSGDGARSLTDLLVGIDYQVVYSEHFLLPSNVNNLFFWPVKNQTDARKSYIRAQRKMDKVCENIKRGKIVRRGFNSVSKGLGLLQGAFIENLEKRYKDSVRINKNKCNLCGLCPKICPVDNLKMTDTKVVAKGNCILCYRCSNRCPKLAIGVFLNAYPKRQYLFKI